MTIERDWELKEAARALRNLDYFSMTDLEKSRLEKELKQQLEKSGMPVKEVDMMPPIEESNCYKDVTRERKSPPIILTAEQVRNHSQLYTQEGMPTQEGIYKFPSGAKRSAKMLRYDLIPKVALDRLAQRFTGKINDQGNPDGGALKYGEGNWEKGLPTSDVINHIINHITQYSNYFRIALTTGIKNGLKGIDLTEYIVDSLQSCSKADDDLAAAMWGLTVLMHQEENGMFHDDFFPI